MDPAPRHSSQKSGPCGAGDGDERGGVISTYAPGSTITVRWQETVPHPGYFRISFDADGQDAFFDPPTSAPAGGDGVLVDAIADKDGTGVYEQQVTLPDVACDRCTLQLVQVMTDKPPYGDGNDLYYQCADLVLSDDEPATTGATAGEDSLADGCGCNAPATSPLALLLLGLVRRQKRSVSPT
jgi:uncharacterized protein (TIGR03382 family)